jgi:hypothetical protein
MQVGRKQRSPGKSEFPSSRDLLFAVSGIQAIGAFSHIGVPFWYLLPLLACPGYDGLAVSASALF